ncbi:MAG: preprotein translocase subunit SecE [Spirosomaceae bacterium]|jgi:preprotein translocase subunit SecE|nr:preprotein translocase subunit SecE [Spirosomataceae bacterium]
MSKVQEFFKNSYEEVTKEVTWPQWGELQGSASLVLIASIIFALVVGAIDFVIDNGLRLLYQSF